MKKNIIKLMLATSLVFTAVALPILAQGNNNYPTSYEKENANLSYLSDVSYLSNVSYTAESKDFSYLIDGTFVANEVFYNEVFGFSFRIPPIWENNFSIFQHHNHTIFMLNEGDFLFGISVFDTSQDADVYHVLPEDFEDNYFILHQDGNKIFAIRVYTQADHSTTDAGYFARMQAPVNGIDDLFSLIDVQDTNINLVHENHVQEQHIAGNFISDGTFFNETFGFSFRMPPLWENNVDIFEHQNHTIFMLNEGDFLFGISVFDTSEEADIYHALPEDFEDNFITLHQSENKIFALRIYNHAEHSTVDAEYFARMQAPVNGIDDLFGLIPTALTPDAMPLPVLEVQNLEVIEIGASVMAPLAVTARDLGFEVVWNEASQTVELSRGNRFLSIQVGNLQYTNNFAILYFESAPVIHEDRLFVPIEFLNLL